MEINHQKIILIFILIYLNTGCSMFNTPIDELIDHCQCHPDGTIVHLKDFTPFQWDEMYSIKGIIYERELKEMAIIEGNVGGGSDDTETVIFLYKKKLVKKYAFKKNHELSFEIQRVVPDSAVFKIRRPFNDQSIIYLFPANDSKKGSE